MRHKHQIRSFLIIASIAALLAAPAAVRAQSFYVSYVSHSDNSIIAKVDSAGTVSTFAPVPFSAGLALDGSGNVFAVNIFGAISKITSSGTVSLFASLPSANGLYRDLAFDGGGNLYAVNDGESAPFGELGSIIVKVTPSASVSVFATLPSGGHGLAFDNSGNLFLSNYSTSQINKILPNGTVSLFATLPSGALGLTFDSGGNLYASETFAGRISKITPSGQVSTFAMSTGLVGSVGLAVDDSNNLYAAQSYGANRIAKISADGQTVSTFATVSNPYFIETYDGSAAPIPIPPPRFIQGDSHWGLLPLLGSPEMIKDAGCFLTSTAMILNSFGHHTDPGLLNQFLSDVIPDNSPKLSFASIPASTTYGQTDGTTGVPLAFHSDKFGLQLTREELADQLGSKILNSGPLILRVPIASRDPNTDQRSLVRSGHAVVAWKVQGDDIFIRDPGFITDLPPNGDPNSLTLDDYVLFQNGRIQIGPTIGGDYEFLLGGTYTFAEEISASSRSTLRGSAHSPVEFVITDPAGHRLGYDPELGIFFNEIPGSIYDRHPLIVSPDGDFASGSITDQPIDFEIGDLLSGPYSLDVYGVGNGEWSINFGISDATSFDPNQFLFSGIASETSHQQFSFPVPEPSTCLSSLVGLVMLLQGGRSTRAGSAS